METSAASSPYFRHFASGRSYEGELVRGEGEMTLAGVHDVAGEIVRVAPGEWILTATENGSQLRVTQAELRVGYGPMNPAARTALETP